VLVCEDMELFDFPQIRLHWMAVWTMKQAGYLLTGWEITSRLLLYSIS